MATNAKLMKSERFYPIFWTQFCGAFNDNFFKNALVILITYKAGSIMGIPSDQMVAAAGGIFILPFFLFSATAGQIADKYEKGKIVEYIKLAEIAIMGLATVGFLLHLPAFQFFVLFLMGLHSTFFGPIKYSILPQHLKAEELVSANALVEAGTFLAILIGTIAGGVLITNDQGEVLVSMGLLAVAVVGWLASRRIPEAAPVDPDLRISWNPITPTWKVYQITKKTRSVHLSILGISWFWLFGAALLALFPGYCKDLLKGSEGVVTLFLATFSIGIGVGSMLCERFSKRQLELGLVPLGSIGVTLFTLDLYFVGQPSFVATASLIHPMDFIQHTAGLRILVDLFLLSIFAGFFIVPLYTLIQERSEPSQRSRVIAANNILNAFFMVISAGFLVFLMRFGLTIPEIFLILALANAVVAAYIYTLLPEFLLRFLIWIMANVMYRLNISGVERIPREGAAIIVCNHVSFIDWLVIAAGIQRPVRFVMDHSFAKGFFARTLLRHGKVILIASAKENPALLKKAFEQTAIELQAGELVCIFPEGAITRDGGIAPFRPGVQKILAETPVPVIPIALRGLWGSFFSREGGRAILKFPKRFWSRVELRIGDPVAPKDATPEHLHARVEELRGRRR
jgi:1-acyl-sn-glycerol-3-phosphate acyltransferase